MAHDRISFEPLGTKYELLGATAIRLDTDLIRQVFPMKATYRTLSEWAAAVGGGVADITIVPTNRRWVRPSVGACPLTETAKHSWGAPFFVGNSAFGPFYRRECSECGYLDY
jgi:hypothetical protein